MSKRSKPRPPPQLDGYQRKALRGLANPLKPLVTVSEGGLSPGVFAALDTALTDHELVKVRLRAPDDKKGAAAALAKGSRSALCGLVGHTVILYRPHPEHPEIELPVRELPAGKARSER
jgi:RNA-binding protein